MFGERHVYGRDGGCCLQPGAAAAIASGNAAQRRTDRLPVTAVAINKNLSPLLTRTAASSAVHFAAITLGHENTGRHLFDFSNRLAGVNIKLPNYGRRAYRRRRSPRQAQALERAVMQPMLHPRFPVAAECCRSPVSPAMVRQL